MPYSIFMIGWEYPPNITGGLGVACRGLARALAGRGHKVHFMLPRIYGDEQETDVDIFTLESRLHLLSEKARQELSSIQRQFEYKNISLSGVPSAYASAGYNPEQTEIYSKSESVSTLLAPERKSAITLEGGYGPNLYNEIQLYARYAELVAQSFDFDLVHSHDWITYQAGLAAARVSGKPLVCHVHATEYDRSGKNVNQAVYDLERKAYHECDRIATVSRFTAGVLEKRYAVPAGKISAVHNGLDHEEVVERSHKPEVKQVTDEKIVLFLGRITFQKGPDYFIQAAKKVLEYFPKVRFVMAGGGDMYHRMIELAADMGIGDKFHFTGPLNRKNVQRMFRLSDLYIMPSVSEPFGIAPLEAVAQGVPVILSKQSGVSEVLKGCLKTDFWNVDELAQKIIFLLKDKGLSNELRESAAGELERITWNQAAVKMETIYETTLTGRQ